MFLSALKKLLSPKVKYPIRRQAKSRALRIESLEDRTVPTTLTVGTSAYPTISSALAAAGANAIIDVPAGTYNTTLTIAKNGIQLVAEGTVIIQPTAVNPVTLSNQNIGGAAIDVYGSNDVVNGFTVDGSQANGNLWFGIRVIEGGSATIKNDTVENILNANTSSANVGIQIGISSQELGVTSGGTAIVDYDNVNAYSGAGVEVDGSAAAATILDNTITGRGTANGGIVEYGVQVSNGATARVQGNSISENTVYGSAGAPNNPTPSSAGIFFYNDGGKDSVAALNSVTRNDDGILVQNSNGTNCNAIQIVNNDVHQNYGYAGIFVLSSNNVEVSCNDVSGNLTYNGIALNNSSNVLVNSNDVYNNGTFGTNSSETDGIYDLSGSDNQILANNSYGNSGNGINIQSSSGDDLFNNVTWNNSLSGIQDYQGTNDAIWLGDAVTNDSDGIFLYETTGDTVVGNVLALNGGYGLHLEGAKNTFIADNLVVGNSDGSIYIDSASSGTVLIDNWTSSPPIKDGTSGVNGSSNSFNSCYSDADVAVQGLCY